MYVFFNVNSESETHFRRSEPETLDNPEKNSGLSGVSGAGWRKRTLNLDSTGQKKNCIFSIQ